MWTGLKMFEVASFQISMWPVLWSDAGIPDVAFGSCWEPQIQRVKDVRKMLKVTFWPIEWFCGQITPKIQCFSYLSYMYRICHSGSALFTISLSDSTMQGPDQVTKTKFMALTVALVSPTIPALFVFTTPYLEIRIGTQAGSILACWNNKPNKQSEVWNLVEPKIHGELQRATVQTSHNTNPDLSGCNLVVPARDLKPGNASCHQLPAWHYFSWFTVQTQLWFKNGSLIDLLQVITGHFMLQFYDLQCQKRLCWIWSPYAEGPHTA